ncbi:hypothetical protein [Croceimicrobium hydrocarbonivorans]|uniref:Uncharacterized protein n=1 Tax=Croceimicrobium hydrocarbonivorans TaxID=2761580 RepID=A0A7H0VHH4_9FLAO|nr:hypothetical protein [Croceimicrobium hydrocarbonivorans]QNR25172.1 hypothetical protein H4K34_04855 [Croceimicrobium hydrocarbonivorans]
MKTFFRWLIKAGLLLVSIILVVFLSGDLKSGPLETFLIILGGSSLLALLFSFLELKYIPYRRKKLMRKIVRLFGAIALTDSVAKWEFGRYEIYIDISFDLKITEQAGNLELISFYIPANQLRAYQLDIPLSQKEAEFRGMKTYRIYQTNGMGLKLAIGRISKQLI